MNKLLDKPELIPFISSGFIKQDSEVFQKMSDRLIESSKAAPEAAKDVAKEIAEKLNDEHEKELELQKILRVADRLLVGNEVVEPLAKLLISKALTNGSKMFKPTNAAVWTECPLPEKQEFLNKIN